MLGNEASGALECRRTWLWVCLRVCVPEGLDALALQATVSLDPVE